MAIKNEASRIYKSKFSIEYNNPVQKLFQSLMCLPGVYIRLLVDEQIEKIIKESVNAQMYSKTKDAVELIRLIYIEPTELQILTWKAFENTVKSFFHRVSTRTVYGTFGFRTEESVWEKSYIQDEVLEVFARLVFYPIILNRKR